MDTSYFLSVKLPRDWTFKQSTDPYSLWRASAASPAHDFFVDIFAIKVHGNVDLEKLAGNDAELLGKVIGEVSKTREIKKKIFWTAAIEKEYQRNNEGLYAKGRFYADGTYGYAVVAFAPTQDFSRADPIFTSFKPDVPLLTNAKNRLSGDESKSSSEIVRDLVLAILLFTVPVGIGLIGFATRRRSWLLTLLLLVCAGLGFFILKSGGGWWSIGIPGILLVLIFAGRYGVVMWGET